MSENELADECFAAAVGLIRGDVESETYAGPLRIVHSEGDAWDVYQVEEHGTDETQSYTDTLQPREFGSAGILAAYLVELAKSDEESVELPKPAGMQGQLLK